MESMSAALWWLATWPRLWPSILIVLFPTVLCVLRRRQGPRGASTSATSPSEIKYYAERRPWTSPSCVLCSKCDALMESRRSILADFQEVNDFDSEIEALKRQLDVTHRICLQCESRVQQKLLDEDVRLRPRLIDFTLSRSRSRPKKSINKSFFSFSKRFEDCKSTREWALDTSLLIIGSMFLGEPALDRSCVWLGAFSLVVFLLMTFRVVEDFKSNRGRCFTLILIIFNLFLLFIDSDNLYMAYFTMMVASSNLISPSRQSKNAKKSKKQKMTSSEEDSKSKGTNGSHRKNYMDRDSMLEKENEVPISHLLSTSFSIRPPNASGNKKANDADDSPATSCDLSALSICSSSDDEEDRSVNSSLSKYRRENSIIRPAKFVAPSARVSWVAGGYWDANNNKTTLPLKDSMLGCEKKSWSQSSCTSSGFVSFSHRLRPSTPLNVFGSDALLRTSSPRPTSGFLGYNDISHFDEDINDYSRMHREQLSLSIGGQKNEHHFNKIQENKTEELNTSFLDTQVSLRSLLLNLSLVANAVAVVVLLVTLSRNES